MNLYNLKVRDVTDTSYTYSSNQLISLFGELIPNNNIRIPLSNGSFLYKFGKGKKLFVLSGVHGNERSGPISIIEYFSDREKILNLPIEFLVCPILDTKGWDEDTRDYGDTNLNRSFNAQGPQFMKELMFSLKQEGPSYFLDIHEDIDKNKKDYLWIKEGAGTDFNKWVAHETSMNLEYWDDQQPNWNNASSEEFIRSVGCDDAITSEVYALRSFDERVQKNIEVISAVVKYILKPEA